MIIKNKQILLCSLLFGTAGLIANSSNQKQKNIIRHMAEMDLQVRNIASQIGIGYDIEASRSAKKLARLAKKYDTIYKSPLPVIGKKNKRVNTWKIMQATQREAQTLYRVIKKNRGNHRKMLNQYERVLKNCRACHKKLEVSY